MTTNWRKIPDEVPPLEENVLVYRQRRYGEKFEIVIARLEPLQDGDTGWRFANQHFLLADRRKITHWMPLPEPPEGDK